MAHAVPAYIEDAEALLNLFRRDEGGLVKGVRCGRTPMLRRLGELIEGFREISGKLEEDEGKMGEDGDFGDGDGMDFGMEDGMGSKMDYNQFDGSQYHAIFCA